MIGLINNRGVVGMTDATVVYMGLFIYLCKNIHRHNQYGTY